MQNYLIYKEVIMKDQNSISVAQYNRLYGTKFKTKKNKFNNKSCWKDGVRFDSRFEIQLLKDLEARKSAGELVDIQRQIKLSLDLNGYHIANYFCDFKLEYSDGTIEYLEAKSPITETDVWKIKWKLAQILYEDENTKFTVAKKIGYGYKFEYYNKLKKEK